MSSLSIGALTDELRHLSDGAVSAAQQLGHGAAGAAHQLGHNAADVAHQLGRARPRPRRSRSLLGFVRHRPVAWLVVGAVVVLAVRWVMMRGADGADAGRPGDVPDRVEPDLDESALTADLGGAMA